MDWVTYLLNRLSREWKVIPKEEAQQKPYYGFRGWLLFFYLLTVIGFIQNLVGVLSPPEASLVEWYGGNPDVMLGVQVAGAIILLPFLALAPLKHALTPKVWIASLWLGVIVSATALHAPGQTDYKIGSIVFGIIIASLMTWYVLHSKRVNATYLSRVPAEGAAKRLQSLPGDPGWKYSRVGWIVVGIVGFLVLGNLLRVILPTE